MKAAVVAELEAGYRRELVLYNTLLEICRAEAAAPPASSRSAEAIATLRRKAAILSEVGEIEAALSPRKDVWERNRGRASGSMGELNALLDRIARVLEEILRLEDDARRKFAIAEGLGLLGAASVPAVRAATYDTPAAATRVSVRG